MQFYFESANFCENIYKMRIRGSIFDKIFEILEIVVKIHTTYVFYYNKFLSLLNNWYINFFYFIYKKCHDQDIDKVLKIFFLNKFVS